MAEARLDVIGVGNAIVDVLAHADDKWLIENKVEKGAMTLVDTERATELYSKMGQGVEVSGGSAANTIVGIASLGGKAAYVGKVKNDQLGEVFTHDIRAVGVEYDTPAATDGPPTARCLIMVTPDAQRSMNTFLGATTGLTADDIKEDQIASAKITYLEGYLFDPPEAKEAFYKAAKIAHDNGRKVALTLSDSFCVDRHRDAFLELVEKEVDILFANETEITSLYQVDTFDEALQKVRGHTSIAALTRSEKGSVIVTRDEIHVIDPVKYGDIVDSTGAGDLYAAGFLYGAAQGWDLVTCGRLGSLAASEVLSHMGPRPEVNLRDLAQKHGLI